MNESDEGDGERLGERLPDGDLLRRGCNSLGGGGAVVGLGGLLLVLGSGGEKK